MKTTLRSKNISSIAFWDVDPSEIDMERDSLMVMARVFNYGKWQDIEVVVSYYGFDRIKREIIHATWLKKTALSFLCLILDLKKQDFVAMQHRNSTIWSLE